MKKLFLFPISLLFVTSIAAQYSFTVSEVSELDNQNATAFQANGLSEKDIADIRSLLKAHEILEVNGCSNIAYVIVKYSLTAKQVGSSETYKVNGKSLNILKKQSDNTWKLFRVLWN